MSCCPFCGATPERIRADYEFQSCLKNRPVLLRELQMVRSSFETHEEFRSWLDDLVRGIELHRI